jgi:hypothetical protein
MSRTWSPLVPCSLWRPGSVSGGRRRCSFKSSSTSVTIEWEEVIKDFSRGRFRLMMSGAGHVSEMPSISSFETYYGQPIHRTHLPMAYVVKFISVQIAIPVNDRCSLSFVSEIRLLAAKIILLFLFQW